MTQFWLIAIPGESNKDDAFKKLNEKTMFLDMSHNFKFDLPELRVGNKRKTMGDTVRTVT
jgi:hypothetical protein